MQVASGEQSVSRDLSLEMCDDVRAQMPNIPSDPAAKSKYDALIQVLIDLVAILDVPSIQLEDLASAADISMQEVQRFLPNSGAAASALALYYSELASIEVAKDQIGDPDANWQGIVHDVFRRGRIFYKKNPVALKIRLGGVQSAGVRHVLMQNGIVFAALLQNEVATRFVIPGNADLTDDFLNAIVITDALWSMSVYRHGEITDEAVEASERAVAGYLEQVLGQRLKTRQKA